jgi:hypothetical protein
VNRPPRAFRGERIEALLHRRRRLFSFAESPLASVQEAINEPGITVVVHVHGESRQAGQGRVHSALLPH